MARVDALKETKRAPQKAPTLDKGAKVKIAIAAVVTLAAFVLLLNYMGAFNTPHDQPQTAAPELTEEQQQEFQRMQQNPPPDPESPVLDPNNPPPAGS